MMNQKDIIMLESLNYFQEQEEREYQARLDYNRVCTNKEHFEAFKKDMLQYGDFTDEELMEMYESELLIEQDL